MNDEVKKIFSEVFEVDINEVENIEYQSVEAWDSIGHMMMISELETKFSVSIDIDDVIVISNFNECIEILNKYRG
jgi:acyl carrier protein